MRIEHIAPLAVLPLLLVGCGSSVDSGEIESGIAEEAERIGHTVGDVTCDENLPAEEGETITCTAELDEEETDILVTAETVDGNEVSMSFEPQH